jgi:prolycopene isomerase
VALHQLSGMGTAEKPGLLRMELEKIGVMEDLEFVEISDLYHVAASNGFKITLKQDRAETIAVLQDKFPSEKDNIQRFFDLLAGFANDMICAFIFKDPEPSREKYPNLYKYALSNSKEILDKYFSDPLLKAVLSVYYGYLGVPPSRLAFGNLAMVFFQFMEFKPYHIKGGSQALSNAIFNKFISYGGRALFSCGAKKITVRDNRVISVVTNDNEEISTEYVVSNASPLTTYTHLIEPEHVPEDAYVEMKGRNLSTSAFTLFIGFDCEPHQLGITETTNFLMDATDISDGVLDRMNRLDIKDDLMALSCYDVSDPGFSPPGTCQTNVVVLKYGEPWLRIPPRQYHDVKFRCAESMLKRVEELYPQVRNHIEEIEVATPLTHMRYLGHPSGAILGYEMLTKDSLFFQPGRNSPIQGLSFVGGWTGGGGFEPTLRSGISAAKSIIRKKGAKEGFN